MTVENARVCLVDANHCPGAVLILFKLDSSTILQTGKRETSGAKKHLTIVFLIGDFRYDPKMQLYNTLRGVKIDGTSLSAITFFFAFD